MKIIEDDLLKFVSSEDAISDKGMTVLRTFPLPYSTVGILRQIFNPTNLQYFNLIPINKHSYDFITHET